MSLPTRTSKDYSRTSLTPIQNAEQQYRLYLKVYKKLSDSKIDKVIAKIKQNQVEPIVVHYVRKDLADKHLTHTPLASYLDKLNQEEAVVAPTLTSYIANKKYESFQSQMITDRLAWRKRVKKDMYAKRAEGFDEEALYADLLQVAIKTGNNSVSGIYAVQGTALFNKTAHSTLTSTTRVTTNIVNVCYERLLSGSLLLISKDSPINYITAMLVEYETKSDAIINIINKYNLMLPTVELVADYLTSNVSKYVVGYDDALLKSYLAELDSYQLAFIYYGGSLWNLAKSNRKLIEPILATMTTPSTDETLDRDACLAIIDNAHEGILNATHHVHSELLAGEGTNHKSMELATLRCIAAQVNLITNLLVMYIDLIMTLVIIDTVAPNLAYTPYMCRSSIVASDTDSSITTVFNWTQWMYGHIYPNQEGLSLTGVLACIAGIVSDDVLRQLSTNLGVHTTGLDIIEMKSEYTVLALAIQNLTKTYAQHIAVQEGNVYKEPKLIVKGVHLKSSNSPKHIIDDAHKLLRHILSTMASSKQINLQSIISWIIDKERDVIKSVLKGDSKYLRQLTINNADNYKHSSPLKNNSGWADYWQGLIHITLPTAFYKIPTTLNNKTALKEYVAALPNNRRHLVNKWLIARKKINLPTIYVPKDYVEAHGLPKELEHIVDIKRILSDVCNIYYIILISLRYYKPKELTLLESEGYDLNQERFD